MHIRQIRNNEQLTLNPLKGTGVSRFRKKTLKLSTGWFQALVRDKTSNIYIVFLLNHATKLQIIVKEMNFARYGAMNMDFVFFYRTGLDNK